MIVFTARPSAISFEAANPRHAHEWTVFDTAKLPEGKVIIPGVFDKQSNFIEHSELIAQRIGRYAERVGRESVIAGTDCGYGTWSARTPSTPTSSGESSPPWPKARALGRKSSGNW